MTIKRLILAALFIASAATAQTPTPTPCALSTLTRWVCVGDVCGPEQYQECEGLNTQAIATVIAQQALQAEEAQAGLELEAERPSWRQLVQTALGRIVQGENQRQQDETAAVSDQAALAGAGTFAQAKPFVQRLIDRERRALDREQELYLFLERLIRAVAALARVAMPTPTPTPTP